MHVASTEERKPHLHAHHAHHVSASSPKSNTVRLAFPPFHRLIAPLRECTPSMQLNSIPPSSTDAQCPPPIKQVHPNPSHTTNRTTPSASPRTPLKKPQPSHHQTIAPRYPTSSPSPSQRKRKETQKIKISSTYAHRSARPADALHARSLPLIPHPSSLLNHRVSKPMNVKHTRRYSR